MENQGFFQNELDIAVALYIDGFTKFSSMTIVHFLVLNFLIPIRTKQKYMLQSCIIPSTPSDLFSFLQPVLEDFEILQNQGINVYTKNDGIYTGNYSYRIVTQMFHLL